MANQTAKNILAFYDEASKQLSTNNTFADKMDLSSISGVDMQNSNNVYWKTVEQQAPVIGGFDLSGVTPGNIIAQTYPLNVGVPRNDYFTLRTEELRDTRFMKDRAKAGANRLSSDWNKRAAELASTTGSMYYESASTGYDFVAEARTMMTERQLNADTGSSFFLTPRNNQIMGSDLASRSLFPNNRSDKVYSTGMIGEQVAGFGLFEAPTYGIQAAAVNATTTTVNGNVTEVPESFVTVSGSIQNVDYRPGTVSLTSAANFRVGDVVTFAGVNSVGLADKTDTGQLMTFKIIEVNTNDIVVYPKPIAANQAGITTSQAAYANISTAIMNTMVVSKVNVAGGQSNSFWANDSMCFVNADGNLNALNDFDGMKVDSQTLDNGIKLYIAYDARLDTLNCRVRLFTWGGLVNKDPSRNGNAVFAP